MHRSFPSSRAAFTMVELMVATAILALIMVLTLQITSNTNAIWQRTRSRIDTFQESRAAFEAMTRNISQAMLNPYLDYVDAQGKPRNPASPASFVPKQYIRQSDLHFISGQSSNLLASVPGIADGQPVKSTTHCIFFQAPLGVYNPINGTSTDVPLPTVLNVSGYFLEFGDEKKFQPSFIATNNLAPSRNRFRLMELSQPSEQFSVYNWLSTGSVANLTKWFVQPLKDEVTNTTGQTPPRLRRPLAENIIALVILPKLSSHDTDVTNGTGLAPKYEYDSRAYQKTGGIPAAGSLAALTRNQLPPLVQVVMVAIDETSAARLESRETSATNPPDFGLSKLFLQSGNPNPPPGNKSALSQDLDTLVRTLDGVDSDRHRATYRIYSTDVSILQAKWTDQ